MFFNPLTSQSSEGLALANIRGSRPSFSVNRCFAPPSTWSDQPILDERQPEHPLVAEDLMQFLVANFGEWRVHHHDQPDRDRNRCCSHTEAIEERNYARDEPPENDANEHGAENPCRGDNDQENRDVAMWMS
jgi:hypothetical protein